jgi:hypothetical protein
LNNSVNQRLSEAAFSRTAAYLEHQFWNRHKDNLLKSRSQPGN